MAAAQGSKGWRALAVAWTGLIVVAGAGAGALQYLGPPAQAPEPQPAVAHPVEPPPVSAAPAPSLVAAPSAGPSTSVAGAIPGPDPALLEAAPDYPGAKLPRIAPGGRASMQLYARPFDAADKRPRVALLVTGVGLSDGDSRAAIALLPPAISLGISPYSETPDALLAAARAKGHEYFVTLPMESQGYPLNNSGVHALLTGVNGADNDLNLEWVLSRMQGEVGVTGASDGLRGERFAAATGAIVPVLRQIIDRGLMYVDPRPNAAPPMAGPIATVTLVIDDIQDPAEIDARLQELEKRAHDSDRVLGLVGRVRPVTMERIAAWARELDARGIALVPVSSLVPRNAAK